MHLTAPSHWSRSIGTGGRDPSERVVTIVGMRTFVAGSKWNQRCRKLAGSKNPEQYPTKEQQKACLEMAAAELIREITQGRSLN
jgi:hypothetical protein